MSSSVLGGVVAVAAVIVVSLLLRAMSGGKRTEARVLPTPPPPGPAADVASADAGEDHGSDALDLPEPASVGAGGELANADVGTSDGRVFVPDGHVVRVLPALSEEERAQYEAKVEEDWESRATYAWEKAYAPQQKYATRLRTPHLMLQAGDLRAVRVIGPDREGEPWRLETIGRDGEYEAYPFDVEADASAALEMLRAREVFEAFEDEHGQPAPPPAGMFEEARKVAQETEAQLELPGDETGEGQEGRP